MCPHFIFRLFRQLTFDVIGRSALGIDSDALRDPQCGFLKHCEDVIEDTTKQPVLYTLGCEWLVMIF